MKPIVAILSIDLVPLDEVLPVLTEYVEEERVTHISLLGKMSREEIMADFSPSEGEEQLVVTLRDRGIVYLGRNKIFDAMQNLVSLLDKLGYEVILLLSALPLSGLTARTAILLEPERIVPPLIASIVDGHQVGIILPVSDLIQFQEKKWRALDSRPFYEITDPGITSDEELLRAGKKLLDRGATVIVLDCVEYLQKHRDFLQKQLDIPVLLSNTLIIRMAAELLA